MWILVTCKYRWCINTPNRGDWNRLNELTDMCAYNVYSVNHRPYVVCIDTCTDTFIVSLSLLRPPLALSCFHFVSLSPVLFLSASRSVHWDGFTNFIHYFAFLSLSAGIVSMNRSQHDCVFWFLPFFPVLSPILFRTLSLWIIKWLPVCNLHLIIMEFYNNIMSNSHFHQSR